MVFKMCKVFEIKPLRFACCMAALYPSLWIMSFEVYSLNVIHHLRWPTKGTYPLFIALRFVFNAEDALALATNEWDDRSQRTKFWGLFFKHCAWWKPRLELVSWGYLLTVTESLHKLSSLNPAMDGVLGREICDVSTHQLSKLHPFRDLMLNYWLYI